MVSLQGYELLRLNEQLHCLNYSHNCLHDINHIHTLCAQEKEYAFIQTLARYWFTVSGEPTCMPHIFFTFTTEISFQMEFSGGTEGLTFDT